MYVGLHKLSINTGPTVGVTLTDMAFSISLNYKRVHSPTIFKGGQNNNY